MCHSKKDKKLFRLFSFTDNIRDKIELANEYLRSNKKIFWILLVLFIIAILTAALNKNPLLCYFFIFLSFIMISIVILPKTFSSLRKFLFDSIIVSGELSIAILYVISSITNNQIILYLALTTFFGVFWVMVSLIADNKISTVTNELYSIMFSVILIIKDAEVNLIKHLFEIEISNNTLISIDMILVPLVVINSTAAVFCILKGYYLDKYKNNFDKQQSIDEINTKIQKLENEIKDLKSEQNRIINIK